MSTNEPPRQNGTASSSNDDIQTLHRLMHARFTCRAYLAAQVPQPVIRSMLDAARASASWCNVQPWDELVVTSGAATEAFRQALIEHARAHPQGASDIPFPQTYEGVYQERRRSAGYQLYAALGIARDDHARRSAQAFENFRLFGAPHVAIVTAPQALGTYGAVDAGGFVSAFLLAAQAHGVATTAQAALALHAGFIRRWFGIAAGRDMVCAIAFGYADMQHPANSYRTPRAGVDALARFVE